MIRIHRLALAATIATVTQIGSGGLVRATGSGEGCPDWPRCFGRWLPPLEYHALIEYAHRFIATIAMVLVFALVVAAIRRERRRPRVLWASAIAGGTILGLAGVGGAVVLSGLNEAFVTVHIALAMVLVAALVTATVSAWRDTEAAPSDRTTQRLALGAALATLAVILVGADVRAAGAGLVFPDWPLMDGRVLPDLASAAEARHFLHRAAVALAAIVVGALVMRVWRVRPVDPAARATATVAGALFVVQAVVGAAQLWTSLAAPPVAVHVLLSSLVWGLLVSTVALTRAPVVEREPARRRRVRAIPAPVSGAQVADAALLAASTGPWERIRAYVQLTKPRIVMLLLITTVPTMALASGGAPQAHLVVWTMIGGTLAAGAANAINMVLDRDIDAVMRRTQGRPLPAHRVQPAGAIAFALVLAAASFALMSATVNILAAVLAQAAIAFYVFVYTIGLKRTTPQNIVIGGAAGAVPVLVGWAAVTGTIAPEALVLFGVIFAWTPPHFWALAMQHRREYEAAGVPMLPVVVGTRRTARQIVAYAIVTVATTLALVPVAGMSMLYTVAAAVLGAWFLRRAVALMRSGAGRAAMALFRSSITYLGLLFVAVGADAILAGGA